ncbi:tetracycline repressor protein class H [Streptomyces sp. CB02959]|uniref:TetR/AcrR family transcriptional regulator C-terminal domain-containing protein n=1 Tax=Streptomyces sp. CB02959 TaxID=2020330 RepID=UPI000C276EE0|nr:TetR/AcrR family transcriptional regulator C-terminal domain-containing protein [Streptomyces sp. CB02959]PJN30499.1 tetracycline repressor protein class H [Streptomyces sp. CB02959]
MTAEKQGARRGRGKRAGLSRQRILDAALDLVDRRGFKALTMRSLGEQLDVEAMTLYHYFPNKGALLDGLADQVFRAAAPAMHGSTDWREALCQYAKALRKGLLRHPAILPLATSRPAVTQATLDDIEACLRMLTDNGFPLGRALHALNAVSVFAIGHAVVEAQLVVDAHESGGTSWLAELETERYPLITKAARDRAGVDDEERFTLAVDAMLLGFDELRTG